MYQRSSSSSSSSRGAGKLSAPTKRAVRGGIAALSLCSVGIVGIGLARQITPAPTAARLTAGTLGTSTLAGFNVQSNVGGDACPGKGKTINLLYGCKDAKGRALYTRTSVLRTSYGEARQDGEEAQSTEAAAAEPLVTLAVGLGQQVRLRTTETLPLGSISTGESRYVETGEEGEWELQSTRDQGYWTADVGTVVVQDDGSLLYTAPSEQGFASLDFITYIGPEGSETSLEIPVTLTLPADYPATADRAGSNAAVDESDLTEEQAADPFQPVQREVPVKTIEQGFLLPQLANSQMNVEVYIPSSEATPRILSRSGPVNPIPDYVRLGGPSPSNPDIGGGAEGALTACRDGERTTTHSGWQGLPTWDSGWKTMGSINVNVTVDQKIRLRDLYGITINTGWQTHQGVKYRTYEYHQLRYENNFVCRRDHYGKLSWKYVDSKRCTQDGTGVLYMPHWFHVLQDYPANGNAKWRNEQCKWPMNRSNPNHPIAR